ATLISLWVPAQELLFLAVIATSTLVTAVLVETATRSESAIATRHALSSPESTASTKAAVIRFSSTRMASSALEHLRLGLLAQQVRRVPLARLRGRLMAQVFITTAATSASGQRHRLACYLLEILPARQSFWFTTAQHKTVCCMLALQLTSQATMILPCTLTVT